ncbi:MAG: 30S ribosomal protein S12 methylthiotransferase RimO [Clostridiales bacterium]|nr:30S ribosomal protein S12 methylthiotransferase RimO [Clostridiales bacterium]
MKVGVISLGCPKNLIDSEIILGILKDNKYEIVTDKEEADAIIVNTCAFIESAQQEAIDTILEVSKLKGKKLKKLVVAGCLAQRYKDEVIKEIPEVDAVLGTSKVGDVLNVLSDEKDGDRVVCGSFGNIDYLNKSRVVSTAKPTAYLKIAEGCDNFCTYCIIPKLRGRYVSRKIEDVVKEAKILSDEGYSEIVLVAQDVTVYGKDLYGKKRIVELIQEISKIDKVRWIRLLYCYPEEITDDLIQEMRTNSKLLNYLDIPIQHASDYVLKKMGRRGNRALIQDVIKKIRESVPDVVIRTSLIVGFPGERDEDFVVLRDFVDSIKFDRLGVFKYSREEGTPAYNMENQVSEKVKEERYNDIMTIQNKISKEKCQGRLGRIYETVVEGVADDGIFYEGRTRYEAPDIDGKIYFTSGEELNIGDFVSTKIVNADDYDLIGVVIDEFAE